jgi:hypothetical protein
LLSEEIRSKKRPTLKDSNVKTFKAAVKLLKTVMTHKDVQQYLTGVGIDCIQSGTSTKVGRCV